MDFWNELLLAWWMIPLGAAIGVVGTLIGAGGGFILMPILLLLYADTPQEKLTAISLAMVFANAVSGSISYARMRRIDYRSGIAFALAGLPGAVLGRYLILMIHSRVWFDRFFGSLMLLGSLFLLYKGLRQPKDKPLSPLLPGPSSLRRNLTLGVIVSFGVGILSSMLGIGGGIIHVPFMIYVLNFPVHVATATSHFVLVFFSGTSVAVDVWRGVLGPGLAMAICLSIGVIPGSLFGAKISRRIQGRWIVVTLAGALLLAAGRILWRN